MSLIRKKLNYTFYICSILSFMVLLLPVKYKIAVYSPSILGWIWLLILIPIALITYIWLMVLDIKSKKLKKILKRTLFFFLIILLSLIYWFYQTKKL